ncbi:hypothetical protein BFP71_08785 [Roseivirga misakiensis]|uniref:Uncharacterized protein n=1 Tax=Roseivirga misakiensis TaxID=1563681 RepID=A0A1E5SKT6_9BACT|nr:hypothetical protein BFP71_08785 [Roseivirga misakiensis]
MIVGDNLALPWQVDTNFKTRPLLLEYFQLNGETSGLYVDQIISWQKYFTEDIRYLGWPETIVFAIFFLALITVSTLVTYLDRFSYFIVSGVIVFVLIQLRLEELGIATDYLTYGVIGGYAIVSYLFHTFYPHVRFWFRLGANLLLYGSIIGVILYATDLSYPHLVTISFGIMGPVILATIFIVFIAGDNIYSLFKLTTQGSSNGKQSLRHFLIIGAIYVGIATLIFLQRTGYTSFSIYTINPYILLILSMTSGYFCIDKKLHGLTEREESRLVKNWLYPIGCSLVLILIAFAKLTVNDSITNALEWVIIISHMTFGLTFFFYAVVNFTPPLLENLDVWPVFFKGLRAPILVARFMAFVMFLGGIFYLNNRPYYQVKAGQYSMLAALGDKVDNPILSEQYYKQSVFYDFYNFKANFSLAREAKRADEINDIPLKLNNILKASTNPKARVAYSNYFADRDLLYRELTTLMNSPEIEESKEVENNLGLAHYRYENYDSAYVYFVDDRQANSVISEGNLAALNYDLAARINFDTTVNYAHTDDLNVMINRQALANAQGGIIPYNLALNKDTILNRPSLFYLYNAALNQTDKDKGVILTAIDYYLASPKNDSFKNFLLMAKAIGHYNQEEVNQAFRSLETAIASSQVSAGFPYFVKAVWAFDQGQAALTLESLDQASKSGYYEPQVKPFIDGLKQVRDYKEQADISPLFNAFEEKKNTLDSTTYVQQMAAIADLNAFDVKTTLKSLAELRAFEYDAAEVYRLLRSAITINKNSTELLSEYIYQCARSGYGSFGKSALEDLKKMVDPENYNKVKTTFESIQEERIQDLIRK